jgi:lipopolysaccharide export system permease protein
MNILDRYLARNIIGATALVILILLGLWTFIEFLTELGEIGKGNYSVLNALVYVPLRLPQDLYQLFPVAGLIGTLLGLGRLASQSELVVMRASGMSKARIIGSVIKATLIMLFFVTILGEVVSPMTESYATHYKALKESGGQTLQTRQGIWVRDGSSFFHINKVVKKDHLHGITRYRFKDQQLEVASYADEAYFKNGEWVFINAKESRFENDRVISQNYPEQKWGASFDAKLLGLATMVANESSLPGLLHYVSYLKSYGLLSSNYEFAFWKRIFQPLATLIMICLAIPFIFGPLRSVTMGLRLLIGIVVGFGFYTLNEFFGPFSLVYQIPPLFAAMIPLLLFAAIEAVLIYRMK